MKKFLLFLLCLFILSSFTLAYCNESKTVVFVNRTSQTGDYNETLIRECSSENDATAGLSLTIFILSITLFLLWLGFRGEYFKESRGEVNYIPLANFMISRACWLLALTTMAFNTGIIVTIVVASGLDLTGDVFAYQWILLRGIYLLMIWLVFGSAFKALNIAKTIANKKKYA